MVNRLESLPVKEQRGSRARCVLFTEGTREEVAKRLTALVAPHAIVDPARHVWAPKVLSDPGKKSGTGFFVWGELGSASSPKAEPDAEHDALLASILDKAFNGNCDA